MAIFSFYSSISFKGKKGFMYYWLCSIKKFAWNIPSKSLPWNYIKENYLSMLKWSLTLKLIFVPIAFVNIAIGIGHYSIALFSPKMQISLIRRSIRIYRVPFPMSLIVFKLSFVMEHCLLMRGLKRTHLNSHSRSEFLFLIRFLLLHLPQLTHNR